MYARLHLSLYMLLPLFNIYITVFYYRATILGKSKFISLQSFGEEETHIFIQNIDVPFITKKKGSYELQIFTKLKLLNPSHI